MYHHRDKLAFLKYQWLFVWPLIHARAGHVCNIEFPVDHLVSWSNLLQVFNGIHSIVFDGGSRIPGFIDDSAL